MIDDHLTHVEVQFSLRRSTAFHLHLHTNHAPVLVCISHPCIFHHGLSVQVDISQYTRLLRLFTVSSPRSHYIGRRHTISRSHPRTPYPTSSPLQTPFFNRGTLIYTAIISRLIIGGRQTRLSRPPQTFSATRPAAYYNHSPNHQSPIVERKALFMG